MRSQYRALHYSASRGKKNKIQQSPQKNRSLLVHILELYTALVEVDIKVTNASLTQNQHFKRVTPPLTHVEIPRLRDTTELNNDGMIKSGDIQYQTEPNLSFFRELINDDSSFCSHILL